LVEEEEWLPVVEAVINANKFTSCTRANGDVGIMFSPERSTFKVGFTIQVSLPVSKSGNGGGFSKKVIRGPGVQGLIVDARRRKVGSDFRSRHDGRKLRKTKKGRNKGSERGKLRCETKKLIKPYSREKPRNRGTKKMQRKIRNIEI